MPIRAELLPLYPPNWQEISQDVRSRQGWRCQRCRRPHLATIRCLPDGRWFDQAGGTWRDGLGRRARWPDLLEATQLRSTRVIIAAAHANNDPSRSSRRYLAAWCQRCHLIHDRPYHLVQRWITYRLRWAIGDLFLGPYDAAVLSAGELVGVLQRHPPATPGVRRIGVVASAEQPCFW